MQNPFENALSQLTRAAKISSVSYDTITRLQSPEREVTVSIPVEMDDGSLKIFTGYRVQHNGARGPYKGGVRFHQDVDMNDVRALSLWMTIKTAVSGIPLGGGKGGITVNPRDLSRGELERLTRGWVRALSPVLGPQMDVPGPDMNTSPEMMSWMTDEYAQITGDQTGATFTGKLVAAGGSEGRANATSVGGWFVFDALRDDLQVPDNAKIAIQGIGNAGINAAKIFTEHGYRVVALSDSQSGVFNPHGLDPEEVETYKREHGSLADFPGATQISNEELLTLDVDVVIPAAKENQITAEIAKKMRAPLILELANGPTTPEADDILTQNNISVIPDILANAGGVVVSCFEWEQNLQGEHWDEKHVHQKLHEIMTREARNVYQRAQDLDTDMRRGAFVIALERIEEALG